MTERAESGVGRGQLVLVAAAVAALALVPVVAAYLQFGYAPAVADTDADHGSRATRVLDRVVDDAAEMAADDSWSDRTAVVERVRQSLAPRLQKLERARVGTGVVVNVTYNDELAGTVDCPRNPDRGRAFGACEPHDGIVVQQRAGETVVVAVALDIQVTTPDGVTTFSRVIRPA